VKFKLPYSDLESISEEERIRRFKNEPLEFSHTLETRSADSFQQVFI